MTVSRDYLPLFFFFNELANTQNLIAGGLSHNPAACVKKIRGSVILSEAKDLRFSPFIEILRFAQDDNGSLFLLAMRQASMFSYLYDAHTDDICGYELPSGW